MACWQRGMMSDGGGEVGQSVASKEVEEGHMDCSGEASWMEV